MATLREELPLQKTKILKKSILNIFATTALFIFIFAFVIFSYFEDPDYIYTKLAFILFAVLYVIIVISIPIYQTYYLKRYFYDMDSENLIIRKGVLANKEITIPFVKITDVYVQQDILDVFFKLYDVHVSTPTAESGQFSHIHGLNKADSMMLRSMILKRVNS